MAKVEIREVSLLDPEIWDRAIAASPHATLGHTSKWLHVLERHSQAKTVLLTGSIGNEVIGAIPIFLRNQGIIRGCYSPIRETLLPYLGPVMPDYNLLKQNKREFYLNEFIQELDRYLLEHYRPNIITLITPLELLDARPFCWSRYHVTPRYSYVKDIGNLDAIWTDFKKTLRKNIKDAEKAGVAIEGGGKEDLDFILTSVSKRISDNNDSLSGSLRYMEDLYSAFAPENMQVFIARYHDERVSGIVTTTYKDKLTIWIGATQADIKGIYPVDLLQWKIIEWAHEKGIRRCEITGANMPSISYFKSRYNFDLALFYVVRKKSFLMRTLSPKGFKF